MKIQGATVIVTGANRGLGVELVRALLAAGAAKVYAGARDPKSLAATLELDKSRVSPLKLDITVATDIAAATRLASDSNLLINNAGVLDFAGALDVGESEIGRNMTTNFMGTFNMSRAFAGVIERNGGGAIVNILTFLSFVSAPIFSAYNASKAASWSMAMSMRPYLAPRGVTVINAFPTSIDTEMLARLTKPKDTAGDVARSIIEGVQAGAEDIYPANAINTFNAWRTDQKAVEAQFAKLL